VNNEHASPGGVAAPAVCGGIEHRQIVRAVSKAGVQLAGMMGMSVVPRVDVCSICVFAIAAPMTAALAPVEVWSRADTVAAKDPSKEQP
jgi:hypothetical protein